MVCFFPQVFTSAFGAFEQIADLQWNFKNLNTRFILNSCFYKNAGRKLKKCACGLKETVQGGEQSGWDDSFQQPKPKMGNGECFFNGEAKFQQPVTDCFWMEIEIQFYKFHGLQCKWIP